MNREAVELVVVESGARWPRWASQCDASDRVVVVNDAATSPMDLAVRAIERVARIEASRRRLGGAILIVGSGNSTPTLEARICLARTLLAHMAGQRKGELVFALSGTRSPSDRLELLALAGTLTEHLSGTRLSVSVRFGDDRVVGAKPANGADTSAVA